MKTMYIGAFHHQPDHVNNELGKLEVSLHKLRELSKHNLGPTINIGEDFNASDINWEDNLVGITLKKYICR